MPNHERAAFTHTAAWLPVPVPTFVDKLVSRGLMSAAERAIAVAQSTSASSNNGVATASNCSESQQ